MLEADPNNKIESNTSTSNPTTKQTPSENQTKNIKVYKQIRKKCWYLGELDNETTDKVVKAWLKDTFELEVLNIRLLQKDRDSNLITLDEKQKPPELDDVRLKELRVYFKEFKFSTVETSDNLIKNKRRRSKDNKNFRTPVSR